MQNSALRGQTFGPYTHTLYSMGLFHCQLKHIPFHLLSNSECLLWTSSSETERFHFLGNISTYLGAKYARRYFWISS